VIRAEAWTVPVALPWIACVIAGLGYALGRSRVNRAHPGSPIPAWRLGVFLAGLLMIALALASPIDDLADRLLAAHMAQHLLLTMVAPPLLALSAPVTLVLRTASAGARRRLMLPLLHSSPVRVLGSPYFAWPLFAAVMWFAHFSPVYNAALDSEALHVAEHAVFLFSGCLFWWPVVGGDPLPQRLGYGARLAYLLLQMPLNAAVGLAIYFAPRILYAHYATVAHPWGIDPLTDQQDAVLEMWAAGDLILLAAVVWVVAAWMQADARRSARHASAGADRRTG
jgi:cytochrome c oxidase assembly factor CtaG